jgi:alcohol dehydrogenase
MYGLPLGGDFGGLFDDLVLVPFAAALVPVPEGVDPVAVASASDNLTDAYRAVEPTLRARPGADVLVLGGTGSIGFYCVAWARFLGAARLDYFDTRDDPALAARLGATVITELPDHDTDGYDLVIDAAADAQVLARGLRLLAPGGHCHSVGIYFRRRHGLAAGDGLHDWDELLDRSPPGASVAAGRACVRGRRGLRSPGGLL